MTHQITRSALVELDCYLDTRIATVARLDGHVAAEIIKNGAYRNRQIDDFEKLTSGKIKQEDFIEAYKNRDKETLALARPTPIVKLVHEISIDQENQKIATPTVDNFVIFVNTYPYDLSEKEKHQVETSVGHYVGIETEVNAISIPPEMLTPKEIRNKWDAVILYDFNSWFEKHVDELNEILIPRNLMFAPALYYKEPDDSPEMKQLLSAGATPFTLMEESMIERLQLHLLQPSEFSLIDVDSPNG